MGSYIHILVLIIIGIVLLWFGYNLLFGKKSPLYHGLFLLRNQKKNEVENYVPQVCPICLTKLLKGEQIKTVAFPSKGEEKNCIMHIHGCYNCLGNGASRECPVCGKKLALDDFLVARMFERSMQKNHIHVLGCNICKKVPKTETAKTVDKK